MSGEGRAQIIFITGDADFEWVRKEVESCAPRVKVLSFLDEMERAYIAADLAVARAGASSVFELAAFGVPTVFVPYPYAADDHQKHNVARLRELGAADIMEDSRLTGDALTEKMRLLLDDTQKRIDMEERMRSWVKIDAAEQAAASIMKLVKKKVREEVPVRGAEIVPAAACETNTITSKHS